MRPSRAPVLLTACATAAPKSRGKDKPAPRDTWTGVEVVRALLQWDEAKRLANIAKHDIDFERAKELWQGRVLEIPSPQQEHGEERFLAYGKFDGVVIAVVFTWRDDRRRLISARKARNYERDWYNETTAGRGP